MPHASTKSAADTGTPPSGDTAPGDSGDTAAANTTIHLTDTDAAFLLANVVGPVAIADFDADAHTDVALCCGDNDSPNGIQLHAGPFESDRRAADAHLIANNERSRAGRAGMLAIADAEGACCDILAGDDGGENLVYRIHAPFSTDGVGGASARLLGNAAEWSEWMPTLAPDANDDGVSDVLLGQTESAGAGSMWLVDAANWKGDQTIEAISIAEITGNSAGEFVSLGDSDGDGIDDYGVGQALDGAALIFLGPLTGRRDLDSADTTITGSLGSGCGTPRGADMDGDGYADVAINDVFFDARSWVGTSVDDAAGAVLVYSGPLNNGRVDEIEEAAAIFTSSERTFVGMTHALADVTDDGKIDLIVSSAPGWKGRSTNLPAVLIWTLGGGGRMEESDALAVIEPSDGVLATEFGRYTTTGDIDDDGVVDLLVDRGHLVDDIFVNDTFLFFGPF